MAEVKTDPIERGENSRRKSFRRVFKIVLVVAGVAFLLVVVGYIVLISYAFNPIPTTYAITVGDFNGDGVTDAFYANGQSEGPQPNTVLLNQGDGKLSDSGQRLGNEESRRATLADLDGDGDLDAWVANVGYNTIFFNDGAGRFTTSKSFFQGALMGSAMWTIALGDLDGDGDPDALGGGCCGAVSQFGDGTTQPHNPYNMVWINQGGAQGGQPGVFPESGRILESQGAEGVALGDLNGDGHLDAFFANFSIMLSVESVDPPQPNTVWWNDGQANFSDSGQRLGLALSTDVALGDLDGDGDLDAYITNNGANEVWLNAGGKQAGPPGTFLNSSQRLGDGYHLSVFLARLDEDADLDAAVVVQGSNFTGGNQLEIWLNDGQGNFTKSSQTFAHLQAQAFALADLNGDGRQDILAGWFPDGYAIWWNRGGGQFTQ